MWKRVENSSNIRPEAIDADSSSKVVYVRKDFKEVPAKDGGATHWEYLEKKIDKSEWAVYEEVWKNMNGIADLEDAVCELSELIGG